MGTSQGVNWLMEEIKAARVQGDFVKSIRVICALKKLSATKKVNKFLVKEAAKLGRTLTEIEAEHDAIQRPGNQRMRDNPLGFTDFCEVWYGITFAPAFRAFAAAFPSEEKLALFLVRRAKWKGATLAATLLELNGLQLPDGPCDLRKWTQYFSAQMNLSYDENTDLLKHANHMSFVEKWLAVHKISFATLPFDRLMQIINSYDYKRAAENTRLAAMAMRWKWPERSFDEALDLLARVSPEDYVPDIHLDTSSLIAPGTEIVKLAKTDPYILVAGQDANSCCHISGATGTLAATMVTRPEVGCYIGRDTNSPDNRKAFLKLTPWLSQPDEAGNYALVLNAWHDSRGISERVRIKVIEAVALAVAEKDSKINRVICGRWHYDLPHPVAKGDERAKPRHSSVRTDDVKTQYIIWDRQKGLCRPSAGD